MSHFLETQYSFSWEIYLKCCLGTQVHYSTFTVKWTGTMGSNTPVSQKLIPAILGENIFQILTQVSGIYSIERRQPIPYPPNSHPERRIRLSSDPWRVATALVRKAKVLNIPGHKLASFLCKMPDSKYLGFVGPGQN